MSTEPDRDVARLRRRIDEAGLLGRRPGYYVLRIGLVVAGLTAFFVLGDSWWQVVVVAFLAVVCGQVALVAHDIAHRQAFRTRRSSWA